MTPARRAGTIVGCLLALAIKVAVAVSVALALVYLLAGAAAAACYDRDVLAAYLREAHGLRLHSWGLTDAGDMHELFLGPTGHWAVVQTSPNACADVVSLPHKERGRLTGKPLLNNALPPRGLYEGEPG